MALTPLKGGNKARNVFAAHHKMPFHFQINCLNYNSSAIIELLFIPIAKSILPFNVTDFEPIYFNSKFMPNLWK